MLNLKRHLLKSFLLFTLLICQNLLAKITFANPQFKEVVKLNSGNYQFEVSQNLIVEVDSEDQRVSTSEVSSRYLNYLQKSSSYQILGEVEKKSWNKSDSMSSFKMKEERQTDHGDMEIVGKSKIVVGSDEFFYHFMSSKIQASGNASYTKSEVQMVHMQVENSSTYILEFVKKVEVDKPFLAPRSIFESRVKEGMRKDIEDFAREHLSLIRGV